MSTQPEALAWADVLDLVHPLALPNAHKAAAELRRLHEVNQELLDTMRLALAQLESFEVCVDHEWGDCRTIEELYADEDVSHATTQTRTMLNKHGEQI